MSLLREDSLAISSESHHQKLSGRNSSKSIWHQEYNLELNILSWRWWFLPILPKQVGLPNWSLESHHQKLLVRNASKSIWHQEYILELKLWKLPVPFLFVEFTLKIVIGSVRFPIWKRANCAAHVQPHFVESLRKENCKSQERLILVVVMRTMLILTWIKPALT